VVKRTRGPRGKGMVQEYHLKLVDQKTNYNIISIGISGSKKGGMLVPFF
jgi:hypothetical protein